MKTNWDKLARNVPSRVKIAPKTDYDVLYTENFHGRDLLGESRPDKKQLIIKNGLTPKIKTETYFHELLHALSDLHDIKLTETQVSSFEKAFPYLLQAMKQLEGINE